MSIGTIHELNVAPSAAPDWSVCFDASLPAAHFDGVVEAMTVRSVDIFTGKLPISRGFFRDVEAGNVSILRSVPKDFGFADAMGILALVGTHARLARCEGLHMAKGDIWIRNRSEDGVEKRSPVLRLSLLSRVSGLQDVALKAILAPFMRDGALRIIPNLDGGTDAGIVLCDGFINDGAAVKRCFVR